MKGPSVLTGLGPCPSLHLLPWLAFCVPDCNLICCWVYIGLNDLKWSHNPCKGARIQWSETLICNSASKWCPAPSREGGPSLYLPNSFTSAHSLFRNVIWIEPMEFSKEKGIRMGFSKEGVFCEFLHIKGADESRLTKALDFLIIKMCVCLVKMRKKYCKLGVFWTIVICFS